jgi:hypothetical protein
MYRIRLASGEQAVYKTVEELAAAVSSGVVSPTAEVFHKAANRWLPINTHPDYRAVVTDKRPALPETPAEVPLPQRHTPHTRKSDASDLDKLELLDPQPEPEPAPPPPPPEPTVPEPAPARLSNSQPTMEAVPDLVAMSEQEAQSQLPELVSRPRRPTLLIALSAGTLVTAAAIAAVLLSKGPEPKPRAPAATSPEEAGMESSSGAPRADSATAPAVASQPTPKASSKAPATPLPSAKPRTDTVAVVYPAPSKPLAPQRTPPAPAAQPGKVTSRLGSSVNRLPSYYEAYADARAEMDESLAYVDFRRVFAPTRFSSPDSIRAARRMVSAAGNILRVYRGREVMLEQTYRPGEPEGKGSLREPFEVAEASRGLLADVDSLFAILVAQEGELRFKDNLLQFQNAHAAQAYNQVRREILQTLSYLGDPAESADRVTMPRLLRGFGTDRPPPAR